MDLSKLTTNNWIGVGGGALTFIAGFLPWFRYGANSAFGFVSDGSSSGFNSNIFSILGILLTLAAAVIMFLKVMDMNDVTVAGLEAMQVAMVLAAAGALLILLRVLLKPTPDDAAAELFGLASARAYGGFIALLAALATAAGAFLSGKDDGIGIPTADDFKSPGGGTGGGSSTF